MRQQRRYLQGNPAIHAVGSVVYRPEKIGRLLQILESQLEEQRSLDSPSSSFRRMASS